MYEICINYYLKEWGLCKHDNVVTIFICINNNVVMKKKVHLWETSFFIIGFGFCECFLWDHKYSIYELLLKSM